MTRRQRIRAALVAAARKAGETRAGAAAVKVAKKVPAPIRKGWATGALVPVPGGATTGAVAGAAVWGKRKIEDTVRARMGQPYRLFVREFMERYDPRKVRPVEASTKLDGVYARATRDGIFTKSGAKVPTPHIEKRLRRYFRKNPNGALEGELWRKRAGIERIAGEARSGQTGKLRLHTYPGQAGRPWSYGATRRVKGHAVKDDAGVEKVYRKALRKGHEGVVVRGDDGRKWKKKPEMDAEYRVEGTSNVERGTSNVERRTSNVEGERRKSVLSMRTADGRPFKVQAGGGAVGAQAGDRVQVRYSGLTRSGKPKGAVAVRVRKTQDFGVKLREFAVVSTRDSTRDEEQIRKDRRALMRGAAVAAGMAGAGYLLLRPGKKAAGYKRVERGAMRGPVWPKNQAVEGRKMLGPKLPRVRKAKPLTMRQAAKENMTRKGGEKRAVRAAKLKRERAYGALKPAGTGRLARMNPAVRARYEKLEAAARGARAVPSAKAAGQLTEREVKRAGMGARQRARQELLAYRERKNFEERQIMKKHEFETAARRVLDFGNAEQWRRADDQRYGSPLKAAAGLEKGYFRKTADGEPDITDIPLGHAQVVKSAYNKANRIQQKAARGGALAKDVVNVARGKSRDKDQAGREKKREWEKPWFKRTARNAVIAGGLIGGAAHLRKNPQHREYLRRKMNQGVKRANRVVPDLMKEWEAGGTSNIELGTSNVEEMRFETPAGRVFEFRQGWGDENDYRVRRGGWIEARARKTAGVKGHLSRAKGKYAGVLAGGAGGAIMAGRPGAVGGALAGGGAGAWRDRRKKLSQAEQNTLRKVSALYKEDLEKAERKGEFERRTSNVERRTSNVERGTSNVEEKSFGVGERILKPLRKGSVGRLLGPSAMQKAAAGDRAALVGRLKAAAAKGNERAAALVPRAAQHAAMKQAGVAKAVRRQKDAVRTVKRGAAVAGAGAVAGGAAMKGYADQPEKRKVEQGARVRNALLGAGAGAYLGGYLHTGKSGFRGARIGAAAGGLIGAVSNPKRKRVIEDLPTASFEAKNFETPARRLIEFDVAAEGAGWDIRDPRGKSARVYAPGSRRRVRRSKEWHEKKENRDRLAAAAVIAAGLGGYALGRKLKGRKPKAAGGGIGYGPLGGSGRVVPPVVAVERARWN